MQEACRNVPMDQLYKGREHLLRALSKEELDRRDFNNYHGMYNMARFSKYPPQEIRNQNAGVGKRPGFWRRILDDLTDAYHWLMR